jgi:hypothetical protein
MAGNETTLQTDSRRDSVRVIRKALESYKRQLQAFSSQPPSAITSADAEIVLLQLFGIVGGNFTAGAAASNIFMYVNIA